MFIGKCCLLIAESSAGAYVHALFSREGVIEQPVTAPIAELAARLPGDFHGNPADRIIVATAVDRAATLVTRDARILSYGKATGFITVIEC